MIVAEGATEAEEIRETEGEWTAIRPRAKEKKAAYKAACSRRTAYSSGEYK